ncbi:hypothetical protein R1sor_012645 [Riccia sorocarpa]|uniref:SWIM-type domain-containing protein n=1 Tax=Riccia sorocarpa TaxID=122646 RepID=A0ABD3IAJ8_9MARC
MAGCTCPQATQENICRHQLGSCFGIIARGFSLLTGGEEPVESANLDLNVQREETFEVDASNSLHFEAEENGGPVAAFGQVHNPKKTKILIEEEAVNVVRTIWRSLRENKELVCSCFMFYITDAEEGMKNLVAAHASHCSSSHQLQSFVAIDENDTSLQRKPDFLERFMSEYRKSNNKRMKSQYQVVEESISRQAVPVPEFVRKLQPRQSMQQTLDSQALQSVGIHS